MQPAVPGTETPVVHRTVLKWLVILLVFVAVASELAGDVYLRRHARRLQLEAARERELAATYRRPVIFGEPVDQNAAIWYRRALAPIVKTYSSSLRPLNEASFAGFEGDPAKRRALLDGPCRQLQATALRDALRCTHCDWELPYQVVRSATDDIAGSPTVAANCLTLEGHERAASGDARGAMRLYLQTISMGCDLQVGDLLMNFIGDTSVQKGLIALARLAAARRDVQFLDEMSRQLAEFESHLSSAHTSVRFERLQVLTVVAIEERAWARFRGRAFSAWHLAQNERILNDIIGSEHVSGGPDGYRLYEQMERRVARAPSAIVRKVNAERWILSLMTAEVVRQLYHATQVAIAVEKWRVTHADYPQDATTIDSRFGAYGLRYRRTTAGYQLIGPRNHEEEAVILEQPASSHDGTTNLSGKKR